MKEFASFEEINSAYPIGTVLAYSNPYTQHGYYFSGDDLKAYRLQYDKVEVINDCEVLLTIGARPIQTVQGYVYDGNAWLCAYETWDGWQTI